MKIAIYLAAVPKNKNELKLAVLNRFGAGASLVGDTVEYVRDYKVIKSDIAVMQGFVHNDTASDHLKLRKNILDNNENTLVIDSNLFQFANKAIPNFYLRYSLNGIFPTTGFYFDNKINESRWESISSKLGITLAEYRTNGDHILICLQRVDGWSMCGTNVQQWLDTTIKTIRTYSTRPIIVRKHPGDRRQSTLILKDPTVRFSVNESLNTDLKNCWATVIYNSSPGIASLISGVPVFVTDPTPQRSQTWPVANTDLSNINSPVLYDRKEWLHRISQSHWNDNEIISGEAWRFMRERLCILKSNLF